MTNTIINATPTDVHRDRIRQLAARMSPKVPARPPWAWTNLTPDEGTWLDDALDEFVDTYNRIHANSVDEVIPACWRFHPAATQELPVQFWAWWNAHVDPMATVSRLTTTNESSPASKPGSAHDCSANRPLIVGKDATHRRQTGI